jgi:hypothetical protein
MNQYKPLLINVKNYPLNFVDNVIPEFKTIIYNTVTNFFPNLNKEDTNIISILTTFIIDIISMRNGFNNNIIYIRQWTQNKCRDIKGVILLLLPFIDDNMNKNLFNKLSDLNQLLYAYPEKHVPKSINMLKREDILSTHFQFGPMGIGLLTDTSENYLLDLYENDEKTIYKIIFHNFLGLLQTLEIMNGKYYINWINIVPLNLDNYKQSYIYMKTKERLNNISIESIHNNITDYYGLWFGDIYNVLRIKYYEDAKKIKWLIFPYENNNKGYYLIQILNKIFDYNSTLLDEFKSNVKLINLKDNKLELEAMKYFLIYLVNNYKGNFNNDIYKKFKLESLSLNEEDKYDDFNKKDIITINDINSDDIIECFNYIKINRPEYIYNYLQDSINLLKKSVYGRFLIVDNMITDYYYYKNTKLNLKNIYNIAKSLSHTTDWVLLDRNYISLHYKYKKEFFNRIYNDITWLNINNNIKRQFMFSNIPNNIVTDILNDFRENYIDLVFEELVVCGILNKFEPYLEITDRSLLPSNFEPRKEMIKKLLADKFRTNKNDYNKSYYYLTGNMFSDLEKIKVERKVPLPNNVYEELTYFDLIAKKQEWPTFYAMDHISQISFFQHYIFHQILYVTGATGQGKSTQVPKLLTYAIKAIDYKFDGKIICTQPRITPTVDNATRIAEELGVPIEELSNNSRIKIKTTNNYVQYKYQDDESTSNKSGEGFLRIVTDGTLFEELLSNPTLKVTPKNNDNIYDIVIVDEAHEHNINMDLIITLSKQACYFNNMVRLIIVSATMDDDEPIYRRYFNTINDKLLFPIKFPIKIANKDWLPDPMYMDRRYHISPPGETTQYNVTEIYLNNNPDTSEIAQEEGYKCIIDICNKSIVGEILFFANGMGEILKAVEYLNLILPEGNIALPFFSELNENYKNIVTKIDTMIGRIRNKRTNIHTEWGSTFIEDMSVPLGTYRRAIIIATNVAEASITINSLKYVVDNGYSKVNKYKPKVNISSLEIEEISEASRIQRKGRVGRVGDGIVYYMYMKNARRDIKPKYKITQENTTPIVLKLIYSKNLDDINIEDKLNLKKLIVSNEINPNLYSFMENISNNIINKETYTFKSGLYTLYTNNYIINNTPLSIYYYNGMPNKTSKDFIVFDSGQIMENILDRKGQYYLINPFESFIDRNIMNNIIAYRKNIMLKEVFEGDYIYILSYLFDKNLLVDINANKLFNNSYDILTEPRNFVITELVDKYKSLSQKFNTTIPETITLIASSAMGCFNEIVSLIIFIRMISPPNRDNLTTIIRSDIKWYQYKEKFNNSDIKSDIIFIHNIISSLKTYFNNLLVFNIMKPEFDNMFKPYINIMVERYKKLRKEKKGPTVDFDSSLWNKLLNLEKNGSLDDNMEVFRKDNYTLKIVMDNIMKNRDKIKQWCDVNYLNDTFIINYIVNFAKYYLGKNINENNDVIIWSKLFRSNFNKYLTTNTIDEKIIRSFLYGYPSQYTFSTNNKNKFVTYMNRSIFPVKFAEPFFKNPNYEIVPETVTNLSNELTFYLTYDEVKNPNIIGGDNVNNTLNVRLLSQIQPEWLIPALPLFMNPLCGHDVVKITGLYDNMSTIEYHNSSGVDRFKSAIVNAWDQDYILWDSEYTPILQYFYKRINKSISKYMKKY